MVVQRGVCVLLLGAFMLFYTACRVAPQGYRPVDAYTRACLVDGYVLELSTGGLAFVSNSGRLVELVAGNVAYEDVGGSGWRGVVWKRGESITAARRLDSGRLEHAGAYPKRVSPWVAHWASPTPSGAVLFHHMDFFLWTSGEVKGASSDLGGERSEPDIGVWLGPKRAITFSSWGAAAITESPNGLDGELLFTSKTPISWHDLYSMDGIVRAAGVEADGLPVWVEIGGTGAATVVRGKASALAAGWLGREFAWLRNDGRLVVGDQEFSGLTGTPTRMCSGPENLRVVMKGQGAVVEVRAAREIYRLRRE